MSAHQTLMNKVYQFQSPFYDLTRKFYLLGRDRLLETIAKPHPSSVLEVGCGTGRNLFKLNKLMKKHLPTPLLVGVDICDVLLYQAEMRKRSRHTNLHFICEGADTFDYKKHYFPRFQAAFCSYSLSMIPNTEACLKAIHHNLDEKGLLYIIDFYDFNGWPAFFRKAHDKWLSFFHVKYQQQTYDILKTSPLFKPVQDLSLYGGYARLIMLEKA
jgi:S-adenosylmethionine-diacylgycerolhomoserine-N-methlytransferase